MTPLSDVMREYAFSDVEEAAASTMAEHVAIGARIADWRALNNRIAFLTKIAERITWLSVLRNEGITLTLTESGKFVSEPKVIPDEIREWIVTHRAAIKAELEALK